MATYDLELFGIVHAPGERQSILESKKLIIKTDRTTPKISLTQKKFSPQLGKWLGEPAGFNPEIRYMSGASIVVADGLCRRQDFVVGVVTRAAARGQIGGGGSAYRYG